MSDRPLLSRIQTQRSLPSLPHILLQLIDLCNRPDKGIRELAKVINQDPSLAERILRLVNSAYYSLKHKISSIDQALLLLGTDAVKNIAISSSVYQVFNRPGRRSAFDLTQFWRHSLGCAAVARLLARRTQYPSPDEAFLAGLLHDIGKIVLWVNFEPEYERLVRSCGQAGAALLEAERDLGATHAEAGAWLIHRWNLRSFLSDALMYHHEPPERVQHSSPLVRIVYAANLLCPASADAEIGASDLAAARAVVGLDGPQLLGVADEAAAEVRETARSLEIEMPSGGEAGPGASPGRGGSGSGAGGSEAPGSSDAPGSSERLGSSEGLGSSAERRDKDEELTGLVRDLSLLHGFTETLLKAQGTQQVLQVLRQAVHLLLDVSAVFYFEYEPPLGDSTDSTGSSAHGGALVGMSTGGDELSDVIRELRIPFVESASLLVRALVQHKGLDTFAREGTARNGALSILDEQLVRFLGTEGMLCLPLRAMGAPGARGAAGAAGAPGAPGSAAAPGAGGEAGEAGESAARVGVLLLGLDRRQRDALAGKRRLLSMIVNLSTLAVEGARARERQLERVREERFAAVSEVARRIVHEAHNPLGIITNYLTILGGKLADNPSVQEDLRIVREEIRRVAQIVGGLSSFSGGAALRRESVDVNAVLSDLSRIAGEAYREGSGVRLALKLERGLPVVSSDPNRLKQVFLNLIKNAAEAMPSGGTITLESRRLEGEPPQIEVCVRDQGGGIAEEVAGHLYEPFHSTKGQQGLGLSIAYGILRELGGSIACDTSPAGTVFRLRLPA